MDKGDRQELMKEGAKLLFDFGKLLFAGIVIAGIMQSGLALRSLFWIGGISVFASVLLGFLLLVASKIKK